METSQHDLAYLAASFYIELFAKGVFLLKNEIFELSLLFLKLTWKVNVKFESMTLLSSSRTS